MTKQGAVLHAVFAATVFCGAFLLFLVEPIVAKQLLPWFGGAANVWATCLVFFQLALLIGYALADLLQRLHPRRQQVLLLAPLLLSLVALPIIPDARWRAADQSSPMLHVLGALATTVGLPYVLMSMSSPLIQSWAARRLPTRSPYSLFALSNLASMLALVCYPSLLEPWVGTHRQSMLWSGGFILWALLLTVCAGLVRRPAGEDESNPAPEPSFAPAAGPASTVAPRLRDLCAWAALAALGSYLLIAVTNHLTRDIAAIPLLWVLPLAIYLMTFIVSFQEPRWMTRRLLTACGLAALAVFGAVALRTALAADETWGVGVQIAAACVVLASGCLLCHGTLARSRPAPRYLTRYYLSLACGGACGALLIGLVAPAVLRVDFDFELGILACAGLVLWQARRARLELIAGALATLVACGAIGLEVRDFYESTVLTERNFYGALRIEQWQADRNGLARSLSNGVILHGTQYFAPSVRRVATEYYAASSGVGRALAALQRDPTPHRIGVIGLGVGTLAAYGRAGDVIRFYEINPAVPEVARQEFSYLGDSAARIELALGDARLSLEREPSQHFDLLVVDAFSSDAIPVHLLTREALAVYLRHLAPRGVIAFHTSNRYVQLVPVVRSLADAYGLQARLIDSDGDEDLAAPSSWVLLTRDARFFEAPPLKAEAHTIPARPLRVWTDDFSDLIEFVEW